MEHFNNKMFKLLKNQFGLFIIYINVNQILDNKIYKIILSQMFIMFIKFIKLIQYKDQFLGIWKQWLIIFN